MKLIGEDQELYVLARSQDRQGKENAMRRRKLKALVHGLNRIKRKETNRDRLIRRVAVLRKQAGRVASFITIREPAADEPVNRQTFYCTFDRGAWKQALERDGSYILRAYIPWEDFPPELEKQAPILWQWYMQLVHVEEAFKALKSDLNLRPIYHQLQHRVEAHILVAFLGYCLMMTLKMKLKVHAPGLTPREALASLSAIELLDVEAPTTDGRTLVSAAAYRTRSAATDDSGEVRTGTAGATAAENPRRKGRDGQALLRFVVQTFGVKTALALSPTHGRKCEGWDN